MRLTSASITSRRRTAAHPPLEADGPVLALSTQVQADLMVVRVSFRADARLASDYPSLHEAVALAVDLPDLGRCESSVLTDPERSAEGPAWTEDDAAPAGAVEGWLTAHVRLDPRLPRPTTLYVRALLRDACSAARRVDLTA